MLGECADEAVDMAGLTARDDTAVLLGTAGDFAALTRFWRGEAGAEVADAVPAHLADLLAARLGANELQLAFTNACVASATAIIHACGLIASGRLESAVCAGAYLVEEENFAKFDSGRALSRGGVIRPFSADRDGLLLGDGAAAVVLESGEAANRRGARPLVNVVGWGASSDAHHIARPHPKGAGLASAAGRATPRGCESGT
ncbi:hypothetical protein GCM10011609_88460 [Lentzea pudingi]|uniref:Ketosynthase family 3 (KS3) domain-containing protein n=1 Tax=Lentzea pudingi TaxID=1789439 RepID=A0ABQ2IVE6_9PSEU|nr:beta-ketoacyl synthase N-terminal-like domain-containing protein [Lentzea pudingi]GGN30577.1 hypothetical protein GCM10011609_88460 [Lentzea pudingi]